MVEAVLFDLFETLITESATRPSGAGSLGPRLGLDATAFRTGWKRRRRAITVGELSFVEALFAIGGSLGSALDTTALEALRRERLLVKARALTALEPGVIALLDE